MAQEVVGSSPIAHPALSACRGAWRSPVAHLLWEQGVAGSNPVAPTSDLPTGKGFSLAVFFFTPLLASFPANPSGTMPLRLRSGHGSGSPVGPARGSPWVRPGLRRHVLIRPSIACDDQPPSTLSKCLLVAGLIPYFSSTSACGPASGGINDGTTLAFTSVKAS